MDPLAGVENRLQVSINPLVPRRHRHRNEAKKKTLNNDCVSPPPTRTDVSPPATSSSLHNLHKSTTTASPKRSKQNMQSVKSTKKRNATRTKTKTEERNLHINKDYASAPGLQRASLRRQLICARSARMSKFLLQYARP